MLNENFRVLISFRIILENYITQKVNKIRNYVEILQK